MSSMSATSRPDRTSHTAVTRWVPQCVVSSRRPSTLNRTSLTVTPGARRRRTRLDRTSSTTAPLAVPVPKASKRPSGLVANPLAPLQLDRRELVDAAATGEVVDASRGQGVETIPRGGERQRRPVRIPLPQVDEHRVGRAVEPPHGGPGRGDLADTVAHPHPLQGRRQGPAVLAERHVRRPPGAGRQAGQPGPRTATSPRPAGPPGRGRTACARRPGSVRPG